MATYNRDPQVFSLCVLSNLSDLYLGNNSIIAANTKLAIQRILADTQVQDLIGPWELVWGPVVDNFNNKSINTMFIARLAGSSPTQYVVAIAGTNGKSKFDWIFEDFSVFRTHSWPYLPIMPTSNPQISHATDYGLTNLVTMTDQSLTARDYLEHHAAQEPGAAVTVTGHSLGGALSPSYALYLYDTQGDRCKHDSGWDIRCNVTINCLPVAGATPGDRVFSDYYYERLGSRTNRYWNKKDVIPHAWEIDMLYQIPTLYAPTIQFDFSNDARLYSLLTLLWALTSGKHYTQLRSDRIFAEDSSVIPVSGDDTFHRFLTELGYQHIDRYGQIFKISEFQEAVTRIVPLPQTFFTSAVTKEQSDLLCAQASALVAKYQVSPELIQTFADKSAA